MMVPFSILYRIDLTEAPHHGAYEPPKTHHFQYPLPDRPH